MANPGHVTLIRIEERALQRVPIPDRSSVCSLEEDYGSAEDVSTSPDTSCRSSADKSFDLEADFREKLTKFEDIIKKIGNLRLSRNENDDDDDDDDERSEGNANENIDGISPRQSIGGENDADHAKYRDKSRGNRRPDKEDVNNNENDTVELDEDADCRPLNIRNVEEQRRPPPDDRSSPNDDSEIEQERRRKREDSDLIERGPLKSGFPSAQNGHPYAKYPSRVNDSVDVIYMTEDYEKTAEQILRNKVYSGILLSCLDKLSNYQTSQQFVTTSDGPTDSNWAPENGNDVLRNKDPSRDTATVPSIVLDRPDELMNRLSSNHFQAAIISDNGSHSSPSPRSVKAWSDSPASSYNYVASSSRSNSRASSRAQSPGSATNLESPQMQVNVIGSPLGSPQIASNYRLPQTLQSSSSSSSNQSYSDVSSPLNYQTPLNYPLVEQLGVALEGWKDNYDSSGTIVNSSDTIDSAFLLDEFLKQPSKELPEEPQAVSNLSFVPSNYNDQWVSSMRGTSENNAERECPARETQKSEKPMSLNDQANPNNFMSVYTNKQSTSGGTLMNCPINDRTISGLDGFYEANSKNPQIDVSTCHDTYCNIALNNNDRFTKVPVQNASREKHAMFHGASSGEKRYDQGSSTFVSNNYQIPTMIVSPLVPSRPQRNSYRSILPWPSLNMPSVRASERLKEGLHPKEVERAMSNLLKKSVKELTAVDNDGYTVLMCLVSNPEELTKKKAYLAPLVERLGNVPGALSRMNNCGEDALYLAAMNCPEMPFVSGYLAAAMLQKGIDINQKLYHMRGDTLIHSVAAQGDSHSDVLKELLTLKTLEGNPVFNLSGCNYDGKTALHVAIESHDPGRGIKSLITAHLLLENGADLKVKEKKSGDTALHMAAFLSCDPALMKVLLGKADKNIVNELNYTRNTALHMVATVSNVISLERQKEVCYLLKKAGGKHDIPNRNGKMPLALVSPERKEEIRKVLHNTLR